MIEFINTNLIYIAIPLVALAAILWIWSEKRRKKTLDSIISEEMAPALLSSACSMRRSWRNILFTAAWLILAFCLLRPYSGIDIEERKQQTRDILVVFDVSKSMNVVDCYGESRLDYGRNLIRKLAAGSASDRFGLMSFSGLAFVEIPLTSDSVSFDIALDALSKQDIPLGGTNIQIALDQALEEFKEGAEHKVMILISDGEEIGGDYRDAAKKLKDKKVKLITVLTGDERKAGVVRDRNGIPSRNRSGDSITSKADTRLLQELARETGGVFVNFDPNGNSYQQLNALKNEIISIQSLLGENEEIRKPREIYQPFLLLAVVILMIRMFLGERRSTLQKAIVLLAVCLLTPQIKAQQAQPTSPNQLSEEKKAQLLNLQHEAVNLKQDAVNESLEDKFRSLAWYNLATNLTKQHEINPVEAKEAPKADPDKAAMAPAPEPAEPGSFSKADEAYDQAVSLAGEQKGIKASALHNKGTLYQKEAQKIFMFEPDQAVSYLNEAAELFKKALILNPGDIQTRKNLERSFFDLKQALIAKEFHKLHGEAKSKAGNALFAFRKIKDTPLRNPDSTKTVLADSKAVKEKCAAIKEKLVELERTDAQTLYNQVIKHTEQAESKINALDKESSEETDKNFAEAYKLLGGNPDEEPQENQDENKDENKNQDDNKNDESQNDSKNDEKNKQNKENEQDPNKDQQNKENQSDSSDDKNEKQNDQKKEMNPEDEGFFNKNEEKQPEMSQQEKERRAKIQEAEALLRKMSDTEKEVRQHIRERQADMLREEMIRRGIRIPKEADK